jgi:N-acetylneuraminic acid mutarotase
MGIKTRHMRLLRTFLLAMLFSSLFTVQPLVASGDLWVKLSPMPKGSSNFAVATLGEKIWALGPNFTYIYDTSTDKWNSTSVMPVSSPLESYLAVAACEGKIFAFGGYDLFPNGTSINTGSALMFDPTTARWITESSMPTARSYMQANTVGDKIYLIGGWLKNTGSIANNTGVTIISSANEAFDPRVNSWSELAPIPVPVMNYASAVIGDKIYIIGGDNPVATANSTQIFDTKTNIWAFGKSLPNLVPNRMGGMAATATTGINAPARIFVLGGRGWQGVSNVTYIYNPTDDSWATGAPMPMPRYNLAVATLKDRIYAIGGTDGSLGTTTGTWPYQPLISFATNEEYLFSGYQGSTPTSFPSSTVSPLIVTLSTAIVITVIMAVILMVKKRHKTARSS